MSNNPPIESWMQKAAAAILGGGVVALPFERLFGLAADALNPRSVNQSAAAKDRDSDSARRRPIAVIIPDMESLQVVALRVPPLALRLAEEFWPGPLTLLIPARPGLPTPLVSLDGLIGVRLPGDCPAMSLARTTGKILTATSANRSGEPDPLTHEGITDLDYVDLLVHGTVPGPPGSTVVDATGRAPRVVRQGILQISGDSP